ncbi:MAG TPA: PEP-CTERM sorting domain-containing protein [Lacunisphaera sp.]|nr:PEP-CTERM sorting domain-containing protein [Lacunisphaera sp.]
MNLRHLLLLPGLAALSLPVSAQTFAGADNFDSGQTAKWDYVYRLNGATQGTLDFSNNRLDFSKAGAGVGNQYRLWDSDGTASPSVTASSFTTGWTMSMSVTNTLGGLTGGEFATVGLNLFNDANSYSALMLSATSTGNYIRAEGTGFTAVNSAVGDNTDVWLQLTWNAGAQTLAAAYSFDNSTFTPVATFHPTTEWDNSAPATAVSNGFNFGVFVNSDTTAAISSGSVYADNFSVSAVPEPSTYAAFAGLGALGLAFWRRRRAALSAA